MALKIGALRHRISIETVSTFQDAYGQTGEALAESVSTVFATVWGEVVDLSGSEPVTAEQLHSQITSRITIRFYPGISPAMLARVTMDERTRMFDILAVRDPDGRRYMLELDAKERFD